MTPHISSLRASYRVAIVAYVENWLHALHCITCCAPSGDVAVRPVYKVALCRHGDCLDEGIHLHVILQFNETDVIPDFPVDLQGIGILWVLQIIMIITMITRMIIIVNIIIMIINIIDLINIIITKKHNDYKNNNRHNDNIIINIMIITIISIIINKMIK